MTTLFFCAVALCRAGARKLVSTNSLILSTRFLKLLILDTLKVFPPREIFEEFLTLLAKWWLWKHDHKNK